MECWSQSLDPRGEPLSRASISDEGAREPETLSPPPALAWDTSAGVADAYLLMHHTRLHLEVEEGLSVPVMVDEQNATAILETTQRLKEHRERERSALRPIYNFGADSCWAGGDW